MLSRERSLVPWIRAQGRHAVSPLLLNLSAGEPFFCFRSAEVSEGLLRRPWRPTRCGELVLGKKGRGASRDATPFRYSTLQ